MKNKITVLIILLILHIGILYANDYYWDLVNALIYDDFRKTEIIINENLNSMSMQEKRLVMSFTLTYSHGKNTENVLNLLLNNNIFPNNFDLYTAINRNQPNTIIQLLLQSGAKPNGEVLLLAMERQKFDLAKQFIETGVDVNYQYPLSRNYADGMTPLLYASKWDNFQMIRLLVENGAHINARALDGNTALTIARTNGNNEIYNYLIEHGAIDTGNNIVPPSQNTGILDMLDNQVIKFQIGTYRLFGGNNSMKFTGNTNSGNVNYVNIANNRVIKGLFRINGNNLTIIMEGHTFEYRVDSNESFSGNGEVWVRIGN
jgi:ankyrin repeat protein